MRFGLNYLFLCCVFFASPLAAQEVKACLNKSHCTAVKKSTLPKHAVVKTTKKETKKKEVKKSAAKKNVATKKLDESKKIEEPKQLTEPKKNEVEASSQEVPAKKDFSKTHSAISQKLWRGITTSDLELLKKATVAIENKNYDEALKLAQELKTTHGEESKKISLADALIDVVLWNKFSGKIDPKKVSFSDISRFALDNPFYPNLNEIRRNVERVAMANNISYQASEQYFNTNPAETKDSKLYLLSSKIIALSRSKAPEEEKEKESKIIHELLVNIWVKENFSAVEEKDFLEKYGYQLSETDHISRIRRLLWDSKTEDAERINHLVSDYYQTLFSATTELEKNPPKHIDKIYNSVPWKLRSDELLTYRRILWYRSKDKMDDVIDLMLNLPDDSQFPENSL